MNTLKFWAVFTVGVAAGAAVALIYAPDSGVETRRKLKSSLDDASDYVKDKASAVKDATSQFSSQAQDVINRSRSVVSSAVDAATGAANAVTAATKSKLAEFS